MKLYITGFLAPIYIALLFLGVFAPFGFTYGDVSTNEAIYENFESLSIGPIDGQGNWTSLITRVDSIADVVSSPTYSGSRSLHLSRFVSNATYTTSTTFLQIQPRSYLFGTVNSMVLALMIRVITCHCVIPLICRMVIMSTVLMQIFAMPVRDIVRF